ncbi:MAG: lipoprotein insertase outer membrane protein LolB [Gammaproteobacteria bacterium]
MRPFFWVGIVALLTACATPAPRLSDAEAQQRWELRQQVLRTVQVWTLSGRVAVYTPDEGWNASVHWRQHPDTYDLRVIAPLGGGSLQLRGDASGGVVAQTSKGEVYRSSDAESLLRERTGVALPVASLRYWVLGQPDPRDGAAESVLDGHGRLARLRQGGWSVSYTSYRAVGDLELPDRIVLDNGRYKVRLVVDRWDLV